MIIIDTVVQDSRNRDGDIDIVPYRLAEAFISFVHLVMPQI
jgi:hypothetical protein